MSLRGVLPVAAVVALLVPAGAGAAFSPAAVEAELGPGINAAKNSETGRLGFIGTDPGQQIEVPAGSPRAVALDFADSYAAELGIDDARRELDIRDVESHEDGRSTIRLQQVQDGIPVLGGELTVNLAADGDVLSLGGELEPKPADTAVSGVSAEEADDVALSWVAKQYGVSAGELVASVPEKWIYDSRILGGPGLDTPRVVWRTEVTDGTDATTIRELVLIDAEVPAVALNFSQIHDAIRRVCDANLVSFADVPCVFNDVDDRQEGAGPSAVGDVNLAYDFSGQVDSFYANKLGRNSINGAGMDIVSAVRYCENDPDPAPNCPVYDNAFWNGSQMTYGPGLVADDIFAHELTHGVTEFESNLFYYYQSGAINESLSDVFGELFDLQNGPADPAVHRWWIGEDSPSPTIGVIRNMANPPDHDGDGVVPEAGSDPDTMTSPYYTANLSETDAGGVHTNSGVNNKATFLMTDGGSFNGQTVAGLGPDKVLQLYYEVNTNLLNSASDYNDLASALTQACTNLTGGAGGITASDCAQVENAITATEMRTNPPAAPTRTAGFCLTPGDQPNTAFEDDMENLASGNWAHAAFAGPDRWFYPSSLIYATSGIRALRGSPTNASSDSAIAMTRDVTVPPGAFLRFNHSHGFEDSADATINYDGGIVEYSTDGGSTWNNAGPLFAFGGYNGTINTAGNPLGAGTSAFVGESNGYGSARMDLSSLAGFPFRLRFRLGSDNSNADFVGWWIDDVKMYNCPAETTLTSSPAEGSVQGNTDASFVFEASDPAATFECSVDGGAFAACTSPTSLSGLIDGAHSFSVRSIDATGAVDPTPAGVNYSVDLCPPALEKLKKAKKQLKKAKKKLKAASSRSQIEKLAKKVKKKKKKVKKAKALVRAYCV